VSEDNTTIPATNMEPHTSDAPLGAQEIKRLDPSDGFLCCEKPRRHKKPARRILQID
jgi:hypothetical protein